jgi:hypothetical protein
MIRNNTEKHLQKEHRKLYLCSNIIHILPTYKKVNDLENSSKMTTFAEIAIPRRRM